MQKLTGLDSKMKMEQKKILDEQKDFLELEDELDTRKEIWNQQLTEILNIFHQSIQETKQLISDLKTNSNQNNQLLKDMIETLEYKFNHQASISKKKEMNASNAIVEGSQHAIIDMLTEPRHWIFCLFNVISQTQK
jgi:hypothetical protein